MPLFLTTFLAWLPKILVAALGYAVARFGIALVSFVGLTFVANQLYDYAVLQMTFLPYEVIQFLHMFKLLTALKLITAAYIARVTIVGLKKFMFVGTGALPIP